MPRRLDNRQKLDVITLTVMTIVCGLLFVQLFGASEAEALIMSFGSSAVAALAISIAWFSVSGRQLRNYLVKDILAFLLLIVVAALLSAIPMGGEGLGGAFFAAFVFMAGIFLLVGLNCINMLMHYLE